MNVLTPIEENYLKIIFQIQHKNQSTIVYTNDLSYALNYKPATITDMIKKLSKKNYLKYKKYYGVSLTHAGEKIALQVLRRHRLWEYFLVYKLGFKWEDIHDIAEELEHIQSETLIDKLDKYLESPSSDPHGESIPTKNGKIKLQYKSCLLSTIEVGKKVRVVMTNTDSKEFLSYLNKMRISMGSEWLIVSKEPYDQSIILKQKNSKSIQISKTIAENIFVLEK
ncbi:MAG: metal-dependent transcriptional regulator [Chitinophagaceae bacterium]